ncbi:MAG: hypothetical protein PWR03_1500 [Tenuifilum sp.]|jgi:gliding motility-associated-like protein|uniref:T9SS type B sorting domain-containing protein n=1 Tax=Tenuifilum sp. TaxID=2760880 RepID=UPI0024AC76A1|nr:gliding motility-associated C-terminal domain-containing protein [Tenuifilum sp.]MDI3527317.1 hypothetical protein [Tenuifilum sp.]
MCRKISPLTFILIALFALHLNGRSQGFEADSVFTWKLIESPNIGNQSIIQFFANSAITPTAWDFGDGGTSTLESPIHTFNYTSWTDSITVTLSFTINGESRTHSRDIPLSPAFFIPHYDRNLGRLAEYKFIFLNMYRIPNHADSLGNLRFHWFIDGTPLADNAFDDATLGQWPNIYYTFTSAGIHQVKLEVNHTGSGQTAEYTQTIRVQPDLTAGKVPFQFVPNVFTPNEDGTNDRFVIPTSGTGWFRIKFFSRSGALVYNTESSIIQWDGKNNQGTDLPEGIYYYVIEDLNGYYEDAKGFVYLFRGKK